MSAQKWIFVTAVLFCAMAHAKSLVVGNDVTTTLEMRLNYLEKRIADIEQCTRKKLLHVICV